MFSTAIPWMQYRSAHRAQSGNLGTPSSLPPRCTLQGNPEIFIIRTEQRLDEQTETQSPTHNQPRPHGDWYETGLHKTRAFRRAPGRQPWAPPRWRPSGRRWWEGLTTQHNTNQNEMIAEPSNPTPPKSTSTNGRRRRRRRRRVVTYEAASGDHGRRGRGSPVRARADPRGRLRRRAPRRSPRPAAAATRKRWRPNWHRRRRRRRSIWWRTRERRVGETTTRRRRAGPGGEEREAEAGRGIHRRRAAVGKGSGGAAVSALGVRCGCVSRVWRRDRAGQRFFFSFLCFFFSTVSVYECIGGAHSSLLLTTWRWQDEVIFVFCTLIKAHFISNRKNF